MGSRISLDRIGSAIARARRRHPDEWQAEVCEILLVPEVVRVWRQLNLAKQSKVPYLSREVGVFENKRGYWLRLGFPEYRWVTDARGRRYRFRDYAKEQTSPKMNWNNPAAGDYYSLSPSNALNGIRRETWYQFAEDLRLVWYAHVKHPTGEASFNPGDLSGINLAIVGGGLKLGPDIAAFFDRVREHHLEEQREFESRHREFLKRLE